MVIQGDSEMKSCTYPVKMCAECVHLLYATELPSDKINGRDCFVCDQTDESIENINVIGSKCPLPEDSE